MAFNFSQELKHTFHLAGLRAEAKLIKGGDHWRELQALEKTYKQRFKKAKDKYKSECDTRVEMARKRLIDAVARQVKDHKHPWFRTDSFDKHAIQRQAQREVRAHHRVEISLIEREEAKDRDALMERAGAQSKLRDKTKQDFEMATNRRSGSERRLAKPRQRDR